MDIGGGPPVAEPGRLTWRSTLVTTALIIGTLLFGLWALLWALLLPWMVVGDADNGRLGRDLLLVWMPEVGLAALGVVLSVARLGRARPRGWTVLASPTVVVVAIAAVTLMARVRAR